MKKVLLVLFIVLSSNFISEAQSLNDSVNVLYINYFELLKTKERVESLDGIIIDLESKYVEFNSIIKSNNDKIQKLTKAELFSLQSRVTTQRNKIINTSGFIYSANVSLNAIKLLDAVTDYLNEISALNSPENSDLGFSLSTEIESILNQKIIKGSTKINGGKTSKFLSIVKNIIKSPVTQAISSAVPVISSIKSVVDLVMGTATRGKDVTVNDIVEFKTSLMDYLEHYEGLAAAQNDFSQKLNSVDVRKEALILLLGQYSKERITTLNPGLTKKELDTLSITKVITKYYSKDDVQILVDQIINNEGDNYAKLLKDKKLSYPEYGVSQAKFIKDEIDALGKEYLATYRSYQESISLVLAKSEKIGNPTMIQNKITTLDENLNEVQQAFVEALNIESVNKQFELLTNY